jgi:hypothetical protein
MALLLLFSASKSANATIDRVRHFECFNVVRQVDHALREHKSANNLTAELTAHCNRLRDNRQTICLSLVPSAIANITAQLSNKTLPGVICESLGYLRPFTGGRLVTPAQCEKFVEFGRSGLSKETSKHLPKPFQAKEEKLRQVPAACKSLDADQKLSCHVIVRLVYRGLQSGLEKKDSAKEICQKLHNKRLIKLVDTLPAAPKAS